LDHCSSLVRPVDTATPDAPITLPPTMNGTRRRGRRRRTESPSARAALFDHVPANTRVRTPGSPPRPAFAPPPPPMRCPRSLFTGCLPSPRSKPAVPVRFDDRPRPQRSSCSSPQIRATPTPRRDFLRCVRVTAGPVARAAWSCADAKFRKRGETLGKNEFFFFSLKFFPRRLGAAGMTTVENGPAYSPT